MQCEISAANAATQSAVQTPADLATIQQAISILFPPDQVIEVRAYGGESFGQLFSDHTQAAKVTKQLSDSGQYEGVYFTLNRFPADITLPVYGAIKNDYISRRVRLFIDFDPARPSHTSATTEETERARTACDQIKKLLMTLGWSAPLTAFSGNGYHLIFPIDLPNDSESADLIKNVLSTVKHFVQKLHLDEGVDVDQTVFNAARICKAYGTVAQKGENTPDRPHRLSYIIDEGSDIPVSRELLASFAELGTTKTETKTETKPKGFTIYGEKPITKDQFEIWLTTLHNEDIFEGKYIDGEHRWQWIRKARCPWEKEHTTPDATKDFAIYLHDKTGPQIKCFHDHCADRHWEDYRNFLIEKTGQDFSMKTGKPIKEPITAEDADSLLSAPDGLNLTALGNADRLLRDYGKDLKWVCGSSHVAAGNFYVWSGSRWVMDDNVSVLRMAQETSRGLKNLIVLAVEHQWKPTEVEKLVSFWNKSESEHMIKDMISLCRPHVAIRESEFDKNPMMLGVQNGLIDLNDSSFREPQREDLISKQCNATFDPHAECPTWLKFLDETTGGDSDLARYLQQCAGICLTGLTQEHLFFIVVGPAATGKTTFQETLKLVWGDYCVGIDPNSLAAGKVEAAKARPDIAKLRGARLVFANESRAGLRIDEGLLKALSGDDTMTARQLYKAEVDFIPTHKLWLRTNNAPRFDGGDTGMQRRVRKVPFTHVCSNKDVKLREKLRAEANGILLWAIKGWQDYQANGLVEPKVVTEATKEYLTSLDTISIFLSECCELRGNFEQSSGKLYARYKEWTEARGEHPMGKSRVKEELERRGFKTRALHGLSVWMGLRLRDEPIIQPVSGPTKAYAAWVNSDAEA